MANPANFEECIKYGVYANESALFASSIENIAKNVVEPIEEYAQDNFYPGDSKSITETIDIFQAINDKIAETNILYNRYPEKKELMDNILTKMQSIKTQKTSIDAAELGNDCSTYNGNLNAARLGCLLDRAIEIADSYNNNPMPLEETRFLVNKKNGHQTKQIVSLAQWSNEKLIRKTPNIIPNGYIKAASHVSKTDGISRRGSKCNGRSVKANEASSFSNLLNFYTSELKKRDISMGSITTQIAETIKNMSPLISSVAKIADKFTKK